MKQSVMNVLSAIGKDVVMMALVYGFIAMVIKGTIKEAWYLIKESYVWSNVRWL